MGVKIMILEDEEMLLSAISRKLQKSGFEPVEFKDAPTAFEYLENNDPPAAIWLDFYLGSMDGIAFMEKLKQRKEWENIPVIVVSNSASDQKVSAMGALGANKYYLKADHTLEEIIGSLGELINPENER